MTNVTFPAGVQNAVQIGLTTLSAMARDAAAYITAGQALPLANLLMDNGIPQELQPEATRQLAFGYGLFNSQTWTYDPAKVEQAASQLIGRDERQEAARQDVLSQFNRLNESSSYARREAFEERGLNNIHALAADDQRHAIRLMADVIGHESDATVRGAALDALEEYSYYLEPIDCMKVGINLMRSFAFVDSDTNEQAHRILANDIALNLEPHQLWQLAGLGFGSEGLSRYKNETISMLTAMISHMNEGDRQPSYGAENKSRALMRKAVFALSTDKSDNTLSMTKEFALKRGRLLDIGFGQIGDTGYFLSGEFIIHIAHDGRPTLFKNCVSRYSDLKIEGIRSALVRTEHGDGTVEEGENIWLLYRGWGRVEDKDTIERKVPEHEIVTMGRCHGEGPFHVFEFARYANNTSIEEQLVEAGFQEDQSASGFFRRSFSESEHDYGRSTEVVAFVYNGDLLFLGYTPTKACCAHSELMTTETEIYRRDKALVLRTGGLEVEVNQSGFQKPNLLIPLEELVENQPSVIEPAIKPMEVTIDPETGFKYGGVNATEIIHGLKSINSIPIDKLEDTMRPKAKSRYGSKEGFLGDTESLLEVMAEDNDWVLGQGFTHQELAKALRSAFWAAFTLKSRDLSLEFRQKKRSDPELRKFKERYQDEAALRYYFQEKGLTELYEKEIQHTKFGRASSIVEWVNKRGQRFAAIRLQSFGIQFSPMGDDLGGTREMLVINLDAKACLKSADLVPDLIELYGFYEGHGTSWRVSPQDIVRVFDLLPGSV